MKKVLLLCEAYGGGVKTYIDAVTSYNRFSHVEFTTFVSATRSEVRDARYIVNNSLSFRTSPWKLWQSLRELHQLIKTHDIDVLHANSTFSGVLLVLYKQLYRRPLRYIYTPHGYYSFKQMGYVKRAFVRCVERRINASCDQVIHVSTSEEQEALRYKLVRREKSVVIFNGTVEPQQQPRQEKKAFTIVNVARVDAQKNPAAFVQLADRLLAHDAHVQFIWAGDGQLLQAMREVKRLGREASIHFVGHVDEPGALLVTADVYLSTSFYEGLPFSVVEAMAHKLPLLLSDNVGHRDLVDDGQNGLLFQLGDDETVRECIDVLQDEAFRQQIGQQSYQLFQQRFHKRMMLDKLEAVYTA